jgi:chromosome segregation ATPase
MKAVNAPSGPSLSSESISGRSSPAAPTAAATVEDHDSIVMSYKELIREQDQKLVEMTKQLEGIGEERDVALTSSREQSKMVETLLKQNAEMKQLLESRNQPTAIIDDSTSAEVMQLRQQVSSLQNNQSMLKNELQQKDTAINQLQSELARSRQLAESMRDKTESGLSADEQLRLQQETNELRTKVQDMSLQIHSMAQERDELNRLVQQLEKVNELQKKTERELEVVRREYGELKTVKETVEKEQEDLLCLLSDNTEKTKKLKERLQQLGETVSEDEDAEGDNDEDDEEEEDG